MKKIPTIFLRRFDVHTIITETANPETQWVFDGEGIATRKLDGTSCMVRDGRLFKRREATQEQREDNLLPIGFELVDQDPVTGKVVGWVPVGDGPEDRWYREAFGPTVDGQEWPDGTYELLGPKIQGNPEQVGSHQLIRHDFVGLVLSPEPARTFAGLKQFLETHDMEGIVFHHPDGRMAKIKGRDFGVKRATKGQS